MIGLRSARRTARYTPASVLIAVLALLVVLPIGMLVYTSVIDIVPRPGSTGGNVTTSWYRGLFDSAHYVALRNSLFVAVGGTAMAMVLGISLAWLAARTDVPGKGLAQLAGIVPLFVSSLVGAFAWSFLASPRQGFLNIVLRDIGIPFEFNIYSLWGIVFVFGLYYAPYSFLLCYSALSLMNPELEEAARVHRASNRRTISAVTLPLVSPAIAASTLLTFALIIENFPVPELLGRPAGVTTLPSFIYRLMNSAPPRANEAATIGVLLMVALAVVVYVQRRLLSRHEYTTVTGKGFRPRIIPLGRWRWPAFGFIAGYLVVAVVLPFFALAQMALRSQPFISGIGDFFDIGAFDLDQVYEVLDYEPFQIGFVNTIVVGVCAALLGTALSFVMAFTVARSRFPGRAVIEYFAMAPVSVPAIVLGMGVLWAWFLLPLPIYGTLLILILAYVVRFLPQGFGGISSSLRQVHRDLEESAVVSGATKTRSGLEVTIPLIRSSMIASMLMLLILSMRELSVAIFLFTADTRVLSVVIFDFWDSGVFARAAAASLLYSVLLTVIVLVARRWLGVRRAG